MMPTRGASRQASAPDPQRLPCQQQTLVRVPLPAAGKRGTHTRSALQPSWLGTRSSCSRSWWFEGQERGSGGGRGRRRWRWWCEALFRPKIRDAVLLY